MNSLVTYWNYDSSIKNRILCRSRVSEFWFLLVFRASPNNIVFVDKKYSLRIFLCFF
jgi:hypothetical protein